MSIEWLQEGTRTAICPVCTDDGPKRLKLRATLPGRAPLHLMTCGSCSVHFYDDLSIAEYESSPIQDEALKFHLEQGAGIDSMLLPLFRLPRDAVRSYLEIGCGFGFALDFARFAFGWRTQGLDPSVFARAGREQLGIDIELAFLTAETELADAPFDLVVCNEVIEHLPRPQDLIRLLQRVLSDRGAVSLTTPNAAAIVPETPAASLQPILSPAEHLVLFTKASLTRLLRDSGFPFVQVFEFPLQLQAVASRQPLRLTEPPRLDRKLYRGYLEMRAAEATPHSPLSHGLLSRLLKDAVVHDDPARARSAEDDLVASVAKVYGLDLRRPERICVEPRTAFAGWAEFARSIPLNLASILHHQGLRRLQQESDPSGALPYFEAAGRAARWICRMNMQLLHLVDGDTVALCWQSQAQILACLAALDPAAALARLRELATPLTDDPFSDRPPAAALRSVRRDLFTRLINGGRFADAAELADEVAADFGVADASRPVLAQLRPAGADGVLALYGLGILALNHHRDPLAAARYFTLLLEAGRQEELDGSLATLLDEAGRLREQALRQHDAHQQGAPPPLLSSTGALQKVRYAGALLRDRKYGELARRTADTMRDLVRRLREQREDRGRDA